MGQPLKLRQFAIERAELARKLDALERKYDDQFRVVFEAIRRLMVPSGKKRKKIGFQA